MCIDKCVYISNSLSIYIDTYRQHKTERISAMDIYLLPGNDQTTLPKVNLGVDQLAFPPGVAGSAGCHARPVGWAKTRQGRFDAHDYGRKVGRHGSPRLGSVGSERRRDRARLRGRGGLSTYVGERTVKSSHCLEQSKTNFGHKGVSQGLDFDGTWCNRYNAVQRL